MSGMIPDTEKQNSDFVDILTTAVSRMITREDNAGNQTTQLEIDTKKLDYKFQMVSSNTFGRFVFTKERLENLIEDAYNYMEPERADVFKGQILRLAESYGYSIDAKSSETLRDKNNSVSALTHIMNSKSTERKITISEDVKKGFFASMFGGAAKRKESEQG